MSSDADKQSQASRRSSERPAVPRKPAELVALFDSSQQLPQAKMPPEVGASATDAAGDSADAHGAALQYVALPRELPRPQRQRAPAERAADADGGGAGEDEVGGPDGGGSAADAAALNYVELPSELQRRSLPTAAPADEQTVVQEPGHAQALDQQSKVIDEQSKAIHKQSQTADEQSKATDEQSQSTKDKSPAREDTSPATEGKSPAQEEQQQQADQTAAADGAAEIKSATPTTVEDADSPAKSSEGATRGDLYVELPPELPEREASAPSKRRVAPAVPSKSAEVASASLEVDDSTLSRVRRARAAVVSKKERPPELALLRRESAVGGDGATSDCVLAVRYGDVLKRLRVPGSADAAEMLSAVRATFERAHLLEDQQARDDAQPAAAAVHYALYLSANERLPADCRAAQLQQQTLLLRGEVELTVHVLPVLGRPLDRARVADDASATVQLRWPIDAPLDGLVDAARAQVTSPDALPTNKRRSSIVSTVPVDVASGPRYHHLGTYALPAEAQDGAVPFDAATSTPRSAGLTHANCAVVLRPSAKIDLVLPNGDTLKRVLPLGEAPLVVLKPAVALWRDMQARSAALKRQKSSKSRLNRSADPSAASSASTSDTARSPATSPPTSPRNSRSEASHERFALYASAATTVSSRIAEHEVLPATTDTSVRHTWFMAREVLLTAHLPTLGMKALVPLHADIAVRDAVTQLLKRMHVSVDSSSMALFKKRKGGSAYPDDSTLAQVSC